jgi:ATP-binding cassette subfamily E protein 1
MIRSLLSAENYVIAVEHDLSILDYLSDFICVLYGQPGAYGVVTMPYSVREGINIFLAGFIPTENMRFREDELTFKVVENDAEKEKEAVEQQKQLSKPTNYKYPAMTKTLDAFKLSVQPGQFQQGEIVVMLG